MDLSTCADRQKITARLREIYETLRRERQFEQNILMPGWDQLNVDIITAILRAYVQGAKDMREEFASDAKLSKKLDTTHDRGTVLGFGPGRKPRT